LVAAGEQEALDLHSFLAEVISGSISSEHQVLPGGLTLAGPPTCNVKKLGVLIITAPGIRPLFGGRKTRSSFCHSDPKTTSNDLSYPLDS
jgi:hypothetical protein